MKTTELVIPLKIIKAYKKEHLKFRKMMDQMPMFWNNKKTPKMFKKHIEETFPTEHYGSDILIYEATSFRTYLERATMIGYLMGKDPKSYKDKEKKFKKQGQILDLFKIKLNSHEYYFANISNIQVGEEFVELTAEYAMLPLKFKKEDFLTAYNKAIKKLDKKYFK